MHDILIKAMELFGTLAVAFGTIWFKALVEKKNKQQNLDAADDLTETYKRLNQIQPVLDEIRYKTNAVRVMEWSVSNGDIFIGGQSLKKLSISCESHSADVKDMASDFQLIPIQVFSKRIEKLAKSEDGWIITYADEDTDYLSELLRTYDIKTSYLFKINNQFDKWIGILCVAFSEHEIHLEDSLIALCRVQVSKLGSIK